MSKLVSEFIFFDQTCPLQLGQTGYVRYTNPKCIFPHFGSSSCKIVNILFWGFSFIHLIWSYSEHLDKPYNYFTLPPFMRAAKQQEASQLDRNPGYDCFVGLRATCSWREDIYERCVAFIWKKIRWYLVFSPSWYIYVFRR